MDARNVSPGAADRPLGYSETLLHLLHHVTGLIVLQVLHVSGQVDEDKLRRSLAVIQSRHAILQCQIAVRGIRTFNRAPFVSPKFVFTRAGTKDIPLRVVDADWRPVMSEELNRPIRGRAVPRLRVTLVRDPGEARLSHIVICADHATIDAKSVNMISGELLELMGTDELPAVEGAQAGPLPPPLEARLHTPPQPGSRYQPSIALPNQHIKKLLHPTRLIDRRLDAAATAGLKARIRANRTSLHGALAAAFMQAERDKFGISEVTMLSTIDMRRLCQPPMPANVFGCYIDILRTRHAITADLWELAREVSFGVINTLAKTRTNASILKMWGWRFYLGEVPLMATNGRRIDALAITSAGESGLRTSYGPLGIESVSMAVSLSLFGPSIFVIASERDGGLDLSIGYSTGGLRTADAEELVNRAVQLLGET
jgi:hypothetical protein